MAGAMLRPWARKRTPRFAASNSFASAPNSVELERDSVLKIKDRLHGTQHRNKLQPVAWKRIGDFVEARQRGFQMLSAIKRNETARKHLRHGARFRQRSNAILRPVLDDKNPLQPRPLG